MIIAFSLAKWLSQLIVQSNDEHKIEISDRKIMLTPQTVCM